MRGARRPASPTAHPCGTAGRLPPYGPYGAHPFSPSTQIMAATSSVLAATIPAPNEPVCVVEFARPVLDAGAALLHVLFSEVCGTDVHLHHGKLRASRTRSFPGTSRSGRSRSCAARSLTSKGNAINEGDVVTFLDVHETCNDCYHCLVDKADHAMPAPQGLRHHVQRERRPARRMGRGDLDEAGREDDPAPEGSDARDVHRRRLRSRDSAPRRGHRRASGSANRSPCSASGRSGSRASRFASLSGAERGHRDRRARESPRVRAAHGRDRRRSVSTSTAPERTGVRCGA